MIRITVVYSLIVVLTAMIHAIRIRISWGMEEKLNPQVNDRFFTVPLTVVCVYYGYDKSILYLFLIFICCLSIWFGFYDLYLNIFRCKRINYRSDIPSWWRVNLSFMQQTAVALMIWFGTHLLSKLKI